MRALLMTLVLAATLAVTATAAAPSGHGLFIRTAYCLQGHTATGTLVAPGTVAVDPNVIPLGSHLTVAGYGPGRALDTGSAVKGYHVDVWIADCHKAYTFTAYHVPVTWSP